jgi:hypothetical protein
MEAIPQDYPDIQNAIEIEKIRESKYYFTEIGGRKSNVYIIYISSFSVSQNESKETTMILAGNT